MNRFSPGLLLALLGQEAVRRLRAAHNATASSRDSSIFSACCPTTARLGQRELGETVAVDPCILVTLLNPLEADGFSRERGPVNRRRHVIISPRPASGTSIAPRVLKVRAKTHCSPGSTATNANS